MRVVGFFNCRNIRVHFLIKLSIFFYLIIHVQVNSYSIMLGRVSWVEPILSARTQRSAAGEARTRNPVISSQALYHRPTVLPLT